MKDNSLSTNTYRTFTYVTGTCFQTHVKTFSKMANHFCQKSSKACIFRILQFRSITNMTPKYLSNGAWRDFSLSMSASVKVT